MTNINDLPLEILQMIIEYLYNPRLNAGHASFYAASCVSRKWADIAHDLIFCSFFSNAHEHASTIGILPMDLKLSGLKRIEEVRMKTIKEMEKIELRYFSLSRRGSEENSPGDGKEGRVAQWLDKMLYGINPCGVARKMHCEDVS